MKLVKLRTAAGKDAIGVLYGEEIVLLNFSGGQYQTLSDILESDDPVGTVHFLVDTDAEPLPLESVKLLAPIDRQEVWAAGVTYTRSKTARMKESVGAAVFYDQVYEAQRPELFFKATPSRVVGPGQPVRIRKDAKWNVPEPELTLVLNSKMHLVGYTIGNDMSSRDIEGENPLYLPQAKVYDQCCALGPCITLAPSMPSREKVGIRMSIVRGGNTIFEGSTKLTQLARTYQDLIEFLGRDNTFRDGVFLLTGTGIVPTDDFSLCPGDIVGITIDGIGTLTNPVTRR